MNFQKGKATPKVRVAGQLPLPFEKNGSKLGPPTIMMSDDKSEGRGSIELRKIDSTNSLETLTESNLPQLK